MQRPSREELIALAKADPEAIADLVLMLWDRVEALEKRIAELERNSRTSSKPPSTDKGNFTNSPKPKSLRRKSGRKSGGQKGHPGSTLKPVPNPDHRIDHDLPAKTSCPDCGNQLPASMRQKGDWEVRQVFDIPPISLQVTEHRARRCSCPDCGTAIGAPFPESVKAPVQYGSRVQAAALYLGSYQLLPYGRFSELFGELFNCPLSQGTLANIVKRGSRQAALGMEPVREALLASPVAHADETSCTLHGKRHWLHPPSPRLRRTGCFWHRKTHLLSSRCQTWPRSDGSHGTSAALPESARPRLPGSLLRLHRMQSRTLQLPPPARTDLSSRTTRPAMGGGNDQTHAQSQGSRRARGRAGKRHPPDHRRREVEKILSRYDNLLAWGYAANPEPPPRPKGKKGRPKRGKILCLLDRFDRYRQEIMGYFLYPEVYPYDNNQAERDVRMMKVREKISGTFRSAEHGKGFCDLRGIISSARKQSRSILECLTQLMASPADLGHSLAQGTCIGTPRRC